MRTSPLAQGAVVALVLTLLPACTTGTPTGPTTGTTPAASATAGASSTPAGSPTPTPEPTPEPEPPAPSPEPSAPPTDGRAPVGVVVTIASQNPSTGDVEVAGYAETLEPDGTCTLELTSGGRTQTAEQGAEPDVTSTTCGLLTVARSRLAAGTWTAELVYTSSRSEGRSPAVQIEVR